MRVRDQVLGDMWDRECEKKELDLEVIWEMVWKHGTIKISGNA